MLFDAHNHLQDERLRPQAEAVLARAAAAGVARMVCCGTRPADWPAVRELAARHAQVVPSYGLHPWYAGEAGPGWLAELEGFLSGGAAVGEIGLDRALEPRDDARQEAVFGAQLRLSIEGRRPVTIHGRRAWGRMLELLEAAGPHPAGLVLHSYSGGAELVARLARLNAFFSFSGTLTFANNRRAHRALCAVPAERLLIETDAPDLAPAGWPPGAPNEPAALARIAEEVARRRGWTPEQAAAVTAGNADRIFGGRG